MRHISIIIFLLCILPLVTSLTLEPRSRDKIYAYCDKFDEVVIESDGPDIGAVTSTGISKKGQYVTFSCLFASGGYSIEIFNDNDVRVEVTQHNRVRVLSVLVISGVALILGLLLMAVLIGCSISMIRYMIKNRPCVSILPS